MRVVFLTNVLSPHMLPLARAVARRVGDANFLYVGEDADWYGSRPETGVRILRKTDQEAQEWIANADLLYAGGLWTINALERHAARGLKTLYYSERWFKPMRIVRLLGLFDCSIPGWVRMLVPSYRRVARRFVKLANENECVTFLPTGPWARRDFLKVGVKAGKLADWGYFVEKGRGKRESGNRTGLRVLWVGRMVGWKRTETLIRAAKELEVRRPGFKVTLVGDGPEKSRLMRDVRDLKLEDAVTFLPIQPMEKVRELMREHDVLVLTSDAGEGWGAVVNEALEEGLPVLGTFEAGASAAMLPKERLYRAGDARALAELIRREAENALPPCSIGCWTAEMAAERLLSF